MLNILLSTDSDQVDTEPASSLLDLYYYKVDQLREILERVYNADDMKRLSIKLSTSQRAPLSVSRYIICRVLVLNIDIATLKMFKYLEECTNEI